MATFILTLRFICFAYISAVSCFHFLFNKHLNLIHYLIESAYDKVYVHYLLNKKKLLFYNLGKRRIKKNMNLWNHILITSNSISDYKCIHFSFFRPCRGIQFPHFVLDGFISVQNIEQ